jgi:hypothetical protein
METSLSVVQLFLRSGCEKYILAVEYSVWLYAISSL